MPAEGREPSRTHSRQQCDRCGMLDGCPEQEEAGGAVLDEESEARTTGALSLSEGCAAAANGLRDGYGGQQRPAGAFADLTCRDAAGGPWLGYGKRAGARPTPTQGHADSRPHLCSLHLSKHHNPRSRPSRLHPRSFGIPSPWPTRRNPSRRSVSPSSFPPALSTAHHTPLFGFRMKALLAHEIAAS